MPQTVLPLSVHPVRSSVFSPLLCSTSSTTGRPGARPSRTCCSSSSTLQSHSSLVSSPGWTISLTLVGSLWVSSSASACYTPRSHYGNESVTTNPLTRLWIAHNPWAQQGLSPSSRSAILRNSQSAFSRAGNRCGGRGGLSALEVL